MAYDFKEYSPKQLSVRKDYSEICRKLSNQLFDLGNIVNRPRLVNQEAFSFDDLYWVAITTKTIHLAASLLSDMCELFQLPVKGKIYSRQELMEAKQDDED